jgi:hypothetical protein
MIPLTHKLINEAFIMAKIKTLYRGYNSSYRSEVEVVQSENGFWWAREKHPTRWGYQFCKWFSINEPNQPTKVRCGVEVANAPEYVEVEKGSYVEYGFSDLRLAGYLPTYRVPK